VGPSTSHTGSQTVVIPSFGKALDKVECVTAAVRPCLPTVPSLRNPRSMRCGPTFSHPSRSLWHR
jgi:hypothetical protein